MPKLETPDGAALAEEDVAQKFAEAMAAPEPDEPQAPAPARRAGAGEDGAGGGAAGASEPRESKGDSKARTRPASGGAAGGTGARRGRPKGSGKKPAEAAPAEGAFVQPVAEFLQALTITGAVAPIPNEHLKVKTRLQAALVNQHAGGLAAAIDSAARHNAVIRRGVEALTMGSAGWVLPAVLAVAPFAAQSAGLWRTAVDEQMVQAAEQFEANVREQLQGQAEDARPAA
jgi:hypothetical protein